MAKNGNGCVYGIDKKNGNGGNGAIFGSLI